MTCLSVAIIFWVWTQKSEKSFPIGAMFLAGVVVDIAIALIARCSI